MKGLLFFLLAFAAETASAQNKTCNLNDGRLHKVYIFTENRNFTMKELFGEEVNPATVFIQYVVTAEQKQHIDSLFMAGNAADAAFIFPDKDASKTIRYCRAEEYIAVIKMGKAAE